MRLGWESQIHAVTDLANVVEAPNQSSSSSSNQNSGHPLELWKAIFDWVAVVLVGLTFIAGAGALITGKILSQRQDAQLRQFNANLTKANSDLARQQTRAATAEGKIAGLQKDASDAKAAQERAEESLLKLRENLKDRIISPEQTADLLKFLDGQPKGPVKIIWSSDVKDSLALSLQIKAIFESSGWTNVTTPEAMGTTAIGLSIAIHDAKTAPAYAAVLQRAFTSVGVSLEGVESPALPLQEVRIQIGHKPPLAP